jgi:hypothetical protein
LWINCGGGDGLAIGGPLETPFSRLVTTRTDPAEPSATTVRRDAHRTRWIGCKVRKRANILTVFCIFRCKYFAIYDFLFTFSR